MLKAELKVVGGKQSGKMIPLGRAKFLIGREQDCQLRPNSDLVSRHHCVFTLDDFTLRLRDLGSTNGTFVNDERIHGQVVLKPGDRVRIGKLEFEVLISEDAAGIPMQTSNDSSYNTNPSDIGSEESSTSATDSETAYELSAHSPESQANAEVLSDDTVISRQPFVPETPPAPYQQPPAPPYPQYAPQQMPPQYFPQGAYYPQYAYPPQGEWAQPSYPPGMYPQPPQGYPAAVPPQQPAPPPAQSADQENSKSSVPPVRLPDPSETGAAHSQPKGENEQKPAGDASADSTPSNRAANIIKQYRERR